MKKTAVLIMLLCAALVFAGCGGAEVAGGTEQENTIPGNSGSGGSGG